MMRDEETTISEGEHRKILYLNIVFLITHIGLACFFYSYHIDLMFFYNIGSILYYIITFRMLKKQYYLIYTECTLMEVVLHMFLATLCMGWNFGFQFYCIGIIPLVVYTMYVLSRIYYINDVKPVVFCLTVTVIFIFLKLYTYYHQPMYHISDDRVVMAMWLVNVMISMMLLLLYMYFFVNAIRRYEKILKTQATRDQLTGLYNRRKLEEIMGGTGRKMEKDHTLTMIAILDIDDFKNVNDKYGHLAGDYVLNRISHILLKYADEDHHVYRWGGEEFVFTCNYLPEQENFERSRIKEIHRVIKEYRYSYDGIPFHITVTIGAAHFYSGMDWEQVFAVADAKLYSGKKCGKDKCIFEDYSDKKD